MDPPQRVQLGGIMGKIEFLGLYFQRFLHLPFKSLALVDIKTAMGHVLTQTLTRTHSTSQDTQNIADDSHIVLSVCSVTVCTYVRST